jgi:CBS domain-containing protein
MEEQGVRELPVCEDGRCCGVIRQVDLRLAERNRGSDSDVEARPRSLERRTVATVREAMSDEFYPVMPTAPLAHVVRTMAAHG